MSLNLSHVGTDWYIDCDRRALRVTLYAWIGFHEDGTYLTATNSDFEFSVDAAHEIMNDSGDRTRPIRSSGRIRAGS